MESVPDTKTFIAQIIQRLSEIGFTPEDSEERWESDGVWVVTFKEGKRGYRTGCGWYLHVSGVDNPLYTPGITFILIQDDALAQEDLQETVKDWEHLKELVALHTR